MFLNNLSISLIFGVSDQYKPFFGKPSRKPYLRVLINFFNGLQKINIERPPLDKFSIGKVESIVAIYLYVSRYLK